MRIKRGLTGKSRFRVIQLCVELWKYLLKQFLFCFTEMNLFYSYRDKANEKTAVHLNPLKVLHVVEEMLDDDSIIVADGGDFVGSAAYILR